MPSVVTHHHFAVSALKKAPNYVINFAEEYRDAFRFGAQGPDILYYHNIPLKSKVADLGRKIHRDNTYEAILSFVSHAKKSNDPILLSYLLGYVCHYVLDSVAHPFVEYVIENKMKEIFNLPEEALHRLCESDIDASVITNYITGDQHMYEAFKLLNFERDKAFRIGELYKKVCFDVYDVNIKTSQIARAMYFMTMALGFLHDETGKRINELKTVEKTINQHGMLFTLVRPIKPLECDCGNFSKNTWFDAKNPHVKRQDSIFDIFEDNTENAAKLMGIIYDAYHKNHVISPAFFEENFFGQ